MKAAVRILGLGVTAVALLGAAPPAPRQVWFNSGTTGNLLMEVCKSQLWEPRGYDACGSYLLGVIDGLSSARIICPLGGQTSSQLMQIAFQAVKNDPDHWHWPAIVIIRNGLRSRYPCK